MNTVENSIRSILGAKPITNINESPVVAPPVQNNLLLEPRPQIGLSEETSNRIVQLEEAVRTLSKQLNELERKFNINKGFDELD